MMRGVYRETTRRAEEEEGEEDQGTIIRDGTPREWNSAMQRRQPKSRRREMAKATCVGTMYIVGGSLICIGLYLFVAAGVNDAVNMLFPPSLTAREIREAAQKYQFSIPTCLNSAFPTQSTAEKSHEGVDLSAWSRRYCGDGASLALYCVRKEDTDASRERSNGDEGGAEREGKDDGPDTTVVLISDGHNASDTDFGGRNFTPGDIYYEYEDGTRISVSG